MTPNEDRISDDSSDDSSASRESNGSDQVQAENPNHPVRQMIRRVRKAQSPSKELEQDHSAELNVSTWDHNFNTPGSTEYSKLQRFASSLDNFSPWPDADHVPRELPDQIGRFRIKSILGWGGFGWVLLADDPQLNRPVALKVPRLDTLISQTGRARFLREARAAALLAHPNLVTVYEAGQVGPVLYIAFEWVDGQPLSQWLTAHRAELSSGAIASMMSALARAVQHAHQRGIVHRDLKPSNILIKNVDLSTVDSPQLSDRAKIADFGLAYLAESDGELTRSGALMGTPKYLAPEQIESTGNQSEPTIDVYGLGAVMYELLTGKPPFNGPTLAAIVRSVEFDAPIPPRHLQGDVPKDLEAICLKCLEKAPDSRYRSAAELADDLDRFVDGTTVRARRPNFLERAVRWIQRNRLVTFAFSFALLSLTIGLAVAAHQAYQAKASLAETQQQRLRAERHRDRAETAVDTLLNDVADTLEAVPQMQPTRRRLLQLALAQERAAMQDEGDDPESQLRVAESLGRIADFQFRLGERDAAFESCNELQQMIRRLPAVSSDQQSRGFVFQAKSQLLKSRILLERRAAAEVEKELSELLNQTKASRNSETARLRATALSLYGMNLRDCGKVQAAELSFLESITTLKNIPDNEKTAGDDRDMVSMMGMIGGLRYSEGRYDEAIEIWKQIVECEIDLDPDVPQQSILRGNRAGGLANLAMAYSFRRDFKSALNYYQQSNDQYRELCQQFPLHFDHAAGRLSALTGRSVALQNAGQYQAAIESYREAVAWGDQLIQRFGEHPRLLTEVSRAWGNLGNVLQFKGDEVNAFAAWNQGLTYVRNNLKQQPDNGTNLADLAFALSNLTAHHLKTNHLEDADLLLSEALPAAQQALETLPGSQKVINVYRALRSNRALLFCLRQDHREGLLEIERIVNLQSDRPDTIVFAAKSAARCQIAVAGNLHKLFGAPEDEKIANEYAAQSLELLASARELGFKDFAVLRGQPEFSQIVTRPEFDELQLEQ